VARSLLEAGAMQTYSKRLVGFFGVIILLAGCAVDPAEDGDRQATTSDDHEEVGQVDQPLKWTRPKCMDDTWVCGDCICNACGVEDCRNAPPPPPPPATLTTTTTTTSTAIAP
jgi:hypothetical protein